MSELLEKTEASIRKAIQEACGSGLGPLEAKIVDVVMPFVKSDKIARAIDSQIQLIQIDSNRHQENLDNIKRKKDEFLEDIKRMDEVITEETRVINDNEKMIQHFERIKLVVEDPNPYFAGWNA